MRIDLHLHLLPGVDDGPVDERAALEHAARLAHDGVHEATVTPHVGHPDYPVEPATIADRTEALQAAVDAAGIDLHLHPGGEPCPGGAAGLLEDGLRKLRPAIEDGALLQVNVSSLLGRHGAEARTAARRLIRDRLAYVIASDGHGGHRRDTLAAVPDSPLIGANPRFLLAHRIPDAREHAWRSPHERRVRAAIDAARQRAR